MREREDNSDRERRFLRNIMNETKFAQGIDLREN